MDVVSSRAVDGVPSISLGSIALVKIHVAIGVVGPEALHVPGRLTCENMIRSEVVGNHVLAGGPTRNRGPGDTFKDIVLPPVTRGQGCIDSIASADRTL